MRPRCIFTNFTSIDVAETFDETCNDREKRWLGNNKENAANLSMITIAYCSVTHLFYRCGIGRYFPMSGIGGSDGTPRQGNILSYSRPPLPWLAPEYVSGKKGKPPFFIPDPALPGRTYLPRASPVRVLLQTGQRSVCAAPACQLW
jgi:hypothetical protein